MTMKNRYFIGSHISERKFREIIHYFSTDLTAIQIAHLARINRNTVNNILKEVRVRIASFANKRVFSRQEKWKWMRVTLGPDEFVVSKEELEGRR